jgi:hypothetical protein
LSRPASRTFSFHVFDSSKLQLLTRLGPLSVVISGSSSVPFEFYSSAPIATSGAQYRFRRSCISFFVLRPSSLHYFFHARPSASAVLLSHLDTFLVRLTRHIQSAVADMLAKSSSRFPASASGLLILCPSYPLSAPSADLRLLSNAGSVLRFFNVADVPLHVS